MTDLAAESQTDRIVRLALLAGELRRSLQAMVDFFESLPPEVQAAAREAVATVEAVEQHALHQRTAGHEQARAGEVGT